MAIIKGNTTLYKVKNITAPEETRILDFLQGAVYCWCKNRKDEWFSLRSLVGGDNFYWEENPLIVIYDKHIKAGSPDPIKSAGKDCGWLLKKVILNDDRNFETEEFQMTRQYKWIQ